MLITSSTGKAKQSWYMICMYACYLIGRRNDQKKQWQGCDTNLTFFGGNSYYTYNYLDANNNCYE